MIGAEVVAKLRPEVHLLEAAVTDDGAVRAEDHGEESVAVGTLVPQGSHHTWIAEHAEKTVPIVGSHLAKHQARGPEDQL